MGNEINGIQVVNNVNPEEIQIKKECTHNDRTESGKERIETEVTEEIAMEVKQIKETEDTEYIVADGIVTYGSGTENKMDMQVTDDGTVTDGSGTENKMDTQVTDDGTVKDGSGVGQVGGGCPG